MELAVLRDDMVDSLEHESKGCVRSERISAAMRTVPREAFVEEEEEGAYADRPFERLGTRVLSPSTAARLLEALAPEEGEDVLVVGVGVGYTAAVLAELVGARNVQGIDITRRLVLEARSNLSEAGYDGVLVDRRDGAEGLPEYAPYDAILLEAAALEPPAALVRQLADDGRLVMPLGAGEQHLAVVERPDGATDDERRTGDDELGAGDDGLGTGDDERGAGDVDGTTRQGPVGGAGVVTERLGGVAFQPMLLEGEQADTVERNRTHREDREFARRSSRSHSGWEQEWIDWDHR